MMKHLKRLPQGLLYFLKYDQINLLQDHIFLSCRLMFSGYNHQPVQDSHLHNVVMQFLYILLFAASTASSISSASAIPVEIIIGFPVLHTELGANQLLQMRRFYMQVHLNLPINQLLYYRMVS